MTLIAHLYRRTMRRGRVIGLLLLSSVPGAVYWLVAADSPPGERVSLYPEIVASTGYSFAIACLILTTAILRDEKDGGTLAFIYLRPIPRSVFAASAIAAGIAAALTIGLGGWLVSAIAALVVGAGLGTAVPGLALFAVASVGYAAIFVPLGYLVPRAVLVGLGYVIVVESIVGTAVAGVAQLSIWRIAVSVYAALAPEIDDEVANVILGPVEPGTWGGLIKTAAVLVAGWAVLTWALKRRDAV